MNSEDPDLIKLSDIDTLRPAIASSSGIAIDTEFMRESTFFAQLCLIQIATDEQILCIDPLNGDDQDAVDQSWKLLLGIPWVLHSGRQDVEVIWQTAGAMPVAVFDTQVAAGLLGYQPQIGYANLVSELFDVQLAKTQTRADWSRRPMSADMLRYAAEDVLYLTPAQDKLSEQLDKLGRLEWARDDSAFLLNTDLYDVSSDTAMNKLKGARNVKGTARGVASHLAKWREEEALQRNRPRQWIIKDKLLLDIAFRQPKSKAELIAVPGMPERTAQRAHEQLLAAIRDGIEDIDDYEPPLRPDEAHKVLLQKMQARVTACAKDLGIASETIAPKKELTASMLGDNSGRVFRGWRAELIGNELAAMAD